MNYSAQAHLNQQGINEYIEYHCDPDKHSSQDMLL